MANLRNVDLNLLKVFVALMRERHVTRAGQQLGLSQPGVSYSLKRLRELFNDPLFIKSKQGLEPTTQAQQLIAPIKAALAQLDLTINGEHFFEPKKTQRVFKLAMPDYLSLLLLPALRKQLAVAAPQSSLEIKSISPQKIQAALAQQEIDLAICVVDKLPTHNYFAELYTEEIVIAADRNHAHLNNQLTKQNFLRLPHLLVDFRQDAPVAIQKELLRLGEGRFVAMTTPYVVTALHLLKDTEMLAALPKRLVEEFGSQLDVVGYQPPIKVAKFPVIAQWHQRSDADAGLQWLVALKKKLLLMR